MQMLAFAVSEDDFDGLFLLSLIWAHSAAWLSSASLDWMLLVEITVASRSRSFVSTRARIVFRRARRMVVAIVYCAASK